MVKKRAYISVFNKEGVVELGRRLEKNGYEIVSTGNTAKLLNENGMHAIESSTITGFNELLGGKVKSLHPKIFAGILANEEEAKTLEDTPFSMVVVNLYPFEDYKNRKADIETLLQNIDIGGVSLLRAGAKNYKNVIVICDIEDYNLDFENIDEQTRQKLALKVFNKTSKYDFTIAEELEKNFKNYVEMNELQDFEAYYLEKEKDLRYGENPHQKAGIYKNSKSETIEYEILNGKEMSYNNMVDTTAALDIASEFFDTNAAVIIKHTNPCGVALGKTLEDAWDKALDCDPLSAFGGIVAFTKTVNESVAKKLVSMFLEVIIAPNYDEKALNILKGKKNLRVIRLNTRLDEYKKFVQKEVKITPFGTLIQEKDTKELNPDTFKVVTDKKPTQEQVEDMVFAYKVAQHLKSNAIVVAKDLRTIGICGGQTSRVGSVEIAIGRVCDSPKDAVLASDGFFPAIDNIQVAVQNRIAAIIQPGGSIKDKEVIDLANKYSLMITTGIRHFKH